MTYSTSILRTYLIFFFFFLPTSQTFSENFYSIHISKKVLQDELVFDTNDYLVTITPPDGAPSDSPTVYDVAHYLDGQHIQTFTDQKLPAQITVHYDHLSAGFHDMRIDLKTKNGQVLNQKTFKVVVVN